jgi:hypothetical protein
MLANQEIKFLQFLEDELALSKDEIALALKHSQGDCGLLPVLFWQYGLANLDEVSLMFDWLETR